MLAMCSKSWDLVSHVNDIRLMSRNFKTSKAYFLESLGGGLGHLWNKLGMKTRFTIMMVKYLQWQLRTDSFSNSVEDDVDSTRHDATVPRHSLDCVRLASAGCSIGEEQLVLALQEVPHHWSHHLPKHRGLATTWTENLGEGVPASSMI